MSRVDVDFTSVESHIVNNLSIVVTRIIQSLSVADLRGGGHIRHFVGRSYLVI